MENYLQREERMVRARDSFTLSLEGQRRFITPPTKPGARAQALPGPTSAAPISLAEQSTVRMEFPCQDCGGSGQETGSVCPEGEACRSCHGSGREAIVRNFLAEALRLAADPASTIPLDRRHIVAIVQHTRQAISAFANLPEVA